MSQKQLSSPDQKAVVLLSGGLDSATTLYLAKKKGYQCNCLIFDYGQRHRKEIYLAKKIAKLSGVPFKLLKINLPWKGSSLLDKKIKLPITGYRLPITIPSTYVPARNTIFLSFALSYAEAIKAHSIFIGVNAIDFSGYPDCRPMYYKVFKKLVAVGTKIGNEGKSIKIFTPLINKTKAQIVRLAKTLGVPFKYTWSCYQGRKLPCSRCDSCLLRAKGFREAKVIDPLMIRGR